MEIKALDEQDIPKALALAWSVFQQFEAPDYPEKGILNFHHSIQDPDYLKLLTFYGAFNEGKLIGMLATRSHGSHIALFFVNSKFHRQGIGRKLFEEAMSHCPSDQMTVNAAPYGVKIYRCLGFTPTDTEQVSDGVRYTPMSFKVR